MNWKKKNLSSVKYTNKKLKIKAWEKACCVNSEWKKVKTTTSTSTQTLRINK